MSATVRIVARACWLVCKRSVKTSIRPHRTPQHANRPPAIVVRSRPVSGQLGLLAPHAVPRRTLNAHTLVSPKQKSNKHTPNTSALFSKTPVVDLSAQTLLSLCTTRKKPIRGGGMTAHAWSQLNRPPTSFYLYPIVTAELLCVCVCPVRV